MCACVIKIYLSLDVPSAQCNHHSSQKGDLDCSFPSHCTPKPCHSYFSASLTFILPLQPHHHSVGPDPADPHQGSHTTSLSLPTLSLSIHVRIPCCQRHLVRAEVCSHYLTRLGPSVPIPHRINLAHSSHLGL